MKLFLFTFFISISCHVYSADSLQVFPSSWWVGMKNPKLQLMVHGKNIGTVQKATISYPGIKVEKLSTVENKNYLFINLSISPVTKAGRFNIVLSGNGEDQTINYLCKARENGNGKSRAQGISSADLVYLVMPDRFSNGDLSNDKFADLLDTDMNRADPLLRHGGDLKGITDHLDYIKELGITSIWLCPVIENNMPLEKESAGMLSGYHGYWFTNHYNVDKRFGGNDGYKTFVDACHQKGLKVIQDAVYNHVGARHWFIDDLPSKDWINQWPAYQNTNHRDETFTDPYASPYEKKVMIEGWFTPHLPDLNLRNPFLANYLIQNAIWVTEYFGIDGWRVDTYKYCDEKFLNAINSALEKEFPSITTFGEAWVNTVTSSAYFCQNNVSFPFKHNSQGVTDFPVTFAMLDGIRQPFGWNEGVSKLYTTLAQDALYKNPLRNCIFLDNHDMDRFYSVAGENMAKFKAGISWLLTMRGIPQLYYGTEILLKNFKNPSDAMVRQDFPGGFPGDQVNKFIASGRSGQENEAFNFIKTLAAFRKTSSALKTGKMMQYIPSDGVYVYFRYDDKQTIMIIYNSSDTEKPVRTTTFAERTDRFSKGRNVISGEQLNLFNFSVPAKTSMILELMK